MRAEKIGPDQIINLIWIIGIVIMIIVLLSTRTPTPGQNYLEITGSGITELVDKGQIVREGITVTWHGDTLCNPEELRVAAQRLIEMADKADRGDMRNAAKP